MTSDATLSQRLTNGIRTALGVIGIIAVILGVLILVAPLKTASIITAIIALYAIAAGAIYAGVGIFAKTATVWSRIGHIVLGVVFVVAGIVAFANLGGVTTGLAVITAILIGVSWIFEGIIAFTTLRAAANKVWASVFAVLSIVAGIIVIAAPFSFAALLWLILGVSLIVLGILQVVRAFTYRSGEAAILVGESAPRL
ncbi:hypothetical protein D9V32_00965 [Mycetocola tolaasinivorans]|uniref:HdeD family acid-resistance protein n=1 Tax=Mycetocola tolaasinivorans TaxID=76635 RepID=A0A3L7AD78_9MICO|nr:DUF308 domain-containing protein [Mycetocola tolaasinivorans]RLP77934.1 hypothetical protein D9V32_00965 [Mycetocola tolaasinivorans]